MIVFLSFHLLVLTVNAQSPTSVACAGCYELKKQIEQNYFSHDEVLVRYLLKQSRDLIDQHPADWHPYYYAGMINVQLGNIIRHRNKEMAYQHYADALGHIQIVHERSPSAESTTVLADVYGKLASLKTLKMLYYGSLSKSNLIDAFRMVENSPKACLVAGIEMMWTPIIFGGDTERARRYLEKALAAAPDWREPDRLIVHWATQAEILAHMAQLEILCKRPSQARHYAAQALSIVPDYGFVLRDVLPQLN
jgi:tetratricopeptide (TPR) repeat protein